MSTNMENIKLQIEMEIFLLPKSIGQARMLHWCAISAASW